MKALKKELKDFVAIAKKVSKDKANTKMFFFIFNLFFH